MENEDNGYAPCTKILVAAIKNEEEISTGGRLFLGSMGFVGMFVIDPAVWIMKKFNIDPGNPDADPNDAGGFL